MERMGSKYAPTTSGVNTTYLENYKRHLTLSNLKDRTIHTKIHRVNMALKHFNYQDAKTLTREQIEDYLIHLKQTVAPATLWGRELDLRLFYRWLDPALENLLFVTKLKRYKINVPVEEILIPDDIQAIIRVCKNQRDRALVMLFWDSGARREEIETANLNNLQFDQQGATIIVDGKTGRRRIRLTISVPDLQLWINQHPDRENPEAPLFTAYNKYALTVNRLDSQTMYNILVGLGKKANIPRHSNPHAFRHGRATELSKLGFTEMELRNWFGWEKNSGMPAVYIHLSGREVDDKILRLMGMEVKPEEEVKPVLNPIKCPRCNTFNSPDTLYCRICSLMLAAGGQNPVDMMKDALNEKVERMERALKMLMDERKGLNP